MKWNFIANEVYKATKMVDYDVMVFVRHKSKFTKKPISDHVIWFNYYCEVGIISLSLYNKLRELLIGKALIEISEIQLIRPRKA